MGVVYKKHYKLSRGARYIGKGFFICIRCICFELIGCLLAICTEYHKKNPVAMHHKCRSFPLVNFSYKHVSQAPLFQNNDCMVMGVLFFSSF